MFDPSAGIAKALPNAGASYRNWTRRHSPKAVTVEGDGLASVAAVDLSPDGATVIFAAASGGTLTRWTLSGTVNALTLAQSDTTYETGLDTISSVAVYAVGKPSATKTTYAVVGEANGSAATARRGRRPSPSWAEQAVSIQSRSWGAVLAGERDAIPSMVIPSLGIACESVYLFSGVGGEGGGCTIYQRESRNLREMI